MKKLFVIFAATLIALISCQKEKDSSVSYENLKTVHFTAKTVDTKTVFGDPSGSTYPVVWTNTQGVKVLLNVSGTPATASVTPDVDPKSASFSATVSDDKSGDYTFYAISPAVAATNYTAGHKDWTVSVPASQTPTSTSVDESAQVLVAETACGAAFPSSVAFDFSHVTAYGKLSLKNLGLAVGETISSVALTSPINWAGSYWYYIEDDGTSSSKGEFKPSSAVKTITINTTSATNIWFACAPVDLGGQDITVVVTTNLGTWTRDDVTIPAGKKFLAGAIASFNVDMSAAVFKGPSSYTKVTSITSGAEYLMCETTNSLYVSSYSSQHLQVSDVTISGGTTIAGTATIDASTFVITALTGSDAGYYSIKYGSVYIGWDTGTNFATNASVASDKYKWSISINGETGRATISNKNTPARKIAYNGKSDFRPYSNPAEATYPYPVLFKLD